MIGDEHQLTAGYVARHVPPKSRLGREVAILDIADGPYVQGRNERSGLQSELRFLRTIGGQSSTLVVRAWDIDYAPKMRLPVEMMLSRAEFDSFTALVQDAIATAKDLTKKSPART